MINSIKTAAAAATLTVLGVVGTVAFAAAPAANDALPIVDAAIPLTQAIAIAEQHARGKASKAEYETADGSRGYDVEVISGPQVFDVRVDADSGTVVSSAADKPDHGDDHDDDED